MHTPSDNSRHLGRSLEAKEPLGFPRGLGGDHSAGWGHLIKCVLSGWGKERGGDQPRTREQRLAAPIKCYQGREPGGRGLE